MTLSPRAERRPFAARDALAVSAWFGLATGIGEVLLLAGIKLSTGRFAFVSQDTLWMAPLAYLVIALLVPGLLLALVVPRVPDRLQWRIAIGVPATLAGLLLLLMLPGFDPRGALLLALGFGIALGRLSGDRWRRTVRRTLPVLFGLVLLSAAAMVLGRWVRERRMLAALPAAPATPNVLLLVLDTVRSFDLSLYGYARETTPRISAWAREGVVFDRAIAPAPWTLPSHAAMFTGHNAHEMAADYFAPLEEDKPTLATLLAASGYQTAGFVANANYCGWETGLQRGFSHYEDWPISLEQMAWSTSLGRLLSRDRSFRRMIGTTEKLARKSAADVHQDFFDWLDGREPNRPFFAFLNYFDAHQPYLPPAPYDTLWGPVRSDGYPHRAQPATPDHRGYRESDLVPARNDYNRAIAYLDAQIGAMLDELGRRGLRENTIIILVGDHGEEFAEHGLVEHGGSLYRQALQVPLVITGPGRVPAGLRVAAPVSTRALPATVLELLGIPGAPVPGRSLARAWEGDTTSGDTVVTELSFAANLAEWIPVSRGTMRSVVVDGFHYIRLGDGTEELYDFERDSTEQVNLAGDSSYAATLDHGRQTLEAVLRAAPPAR
jgi:arylsulfatase A-like enzyme